MHLEADIIMFSVDHSSESWMSQLNNILPSKSWLQNLKHFRIAKTGHDFMDLKKAVSTYAYKILITQQSRAQNLQNENKLE